MTERSSESIASTWRSAAIAGGITLMGGLVAWVANIWSDEIRRQGREIAELRVANARQDAELAELHRRRDAARGDAERSDGSVHP